MKIAKTVTSHLLLILLIAVFLRPAAAAEKPAAPLVLSVEVTGNEHLSEDVILKALTHIRLGEPLNEEAIKKDLQAIKDLGYFSSVDAQGEPFLGGVKIIIRVHENPLFKDFKIEGLKRADPKDILPYFSQKKGEVINLVKIGSDLNEAVGKYRETKGLFLTVIDSKSDISPDGVVTLQMAEVKLGKVNIKGLEKTKTAVVKRELSLKEGEVLDMNRLREDYNRLTRLGLFEDIGIVLQPTSDPEVMDINLEFKEGKTAQFNFGMTYTPAESDLAGYISVVEPNLRGLGQKISFKVESNPGVFYHFNFEFTEPWLDENNTSFGLRLYSNFDNNIEGTLESGSGEYLYDKRSTGLELSLGRPLTRDLRFDTSLQFEKVKTAPKSLVNADSSAVLPAAEEYWNNSVGLGLLQDKRQMANMFYTVGGYQAQIYAGFHGGFLGGKYDYQKYTGEFKHFYSPWEFTTLGYRIKAGTLTGNVPEEDEFTLGGPLSLRGYGDDYVEGNQLLLGNIELRQRVPGNNALEFVAFYDIGSVDYKNYYQSYGLGFRYTVPLLGQLRFDFGWNNEKIEPQPKFHFFIYEMF